MQMKWTQQLLGKVAEQVARKWSLALGKLLSLLPTVRLLTPASASHIQACLSVPSPVLNCKGVTVVHDNNESIIVNANCARFMSA